MLDETVAYDPGPMPEFKSSPLQALQAVWQSQEWVSNLVWLTVASITSSFFVGHIALLGYGSEMLSARAGRPEYPNLDVNSDRLGDYLTKGIWPFLISFVLQFLLSTAISLPSGFIFAAGAVVAGEDAMAILLLLMVPFLIVISILSLLYSVPFVLRCMVCQDFAKSLDFGWCHRFVKLMAGEMIWSAIIFGLLSMVLSLLGLMACFVGVFVASGIIMGGSMNLLAQWYEIYLSRGGEPAPKPVPSSP